MGLIIAAARFADHAHRGQVRKHANGQPVPYIVHPDRVAARVARLYESTEAADLREALRGTHAILEAELDAAIAALTAIAPPHPGREEKHP